MKQLALLLLVSGAVLQGAPRAELSLNKHYCLAPCTIEATITVMGPEALSKGEWVCFSMEDGLPRSSSCWPHRGAKQTTVGVKDIPAGEYGVVVIVRGEILDREVLSVK